ncbi:hypothetical protein [Mesorhizobium sp. 8]|uniref:hypothetical protein n=1 Tax=Mesorhizobium sp. 8 TaxID=2584466 RepID=UPI0011217BCA|nr:hypothetical protein [Mesorhizobium sp. 8]QDB99297.1 hypothetical protein FGU64_02090 [Mesorhizobium sp. 8]
MAREVPCRHGFIDNLCVTASGDIVVIETRLWRNPQMRREVVAQLIRAETEILGNLLQSHAGSRFTFALVELAAWTTPSGDILVVPDTLAKTVMIERGIVCVENGEPVVRPVPATLQSGP